LWSVRQVVENNFPSAASPSGNVAYHVLAGDGIEKWGECSAGEFRQWARFEVQPQGNGRWLKKE
jgi:hypothetical protein